MYIFSKSMLYVICNIVRNEFLRRFDRLVKGRKVEERNMVRKNPLKGKVVTSHTHTKKHKNYNTKTKTT